MTMFDVDTVNVEKKLQEIEDNDLYNFMKKQGSMMIISRKTCSVAL